MSDLEVDIVKRNTTMAVESSSEQDSEENHESAYIDIALSESWSSLPRCRNEQNTRQHRRNTIDEQTRNNSPIDIKVSGIGESHPVIERKSANTPGKQGKCNTENSDNILDIPSDMSIHSSYRYDIFQHQKLKTSPRSISSQKMKHIKAYLDDCQFSSASSGYKTYSSEHTNDIARPPSFKTKNYKEQSQHKLDSNKNAPSNAHNYGGHALLPILTNRSSSSNSDKGEEGLYRTANIRRARFMKTDSSSTCDHEDALSDISDQTEESRKLEDFGLSFSDDDQCDTHKPKPPPLSPRSQMLHRRKFHKSNFVKSRVKSQLSNNACKNIKTKYNMPNAFCPTSRYSKEARLTSSKLSSKSRSKWPETPMYPPKARHAETQCEILRWVETTDTGIQAIPETLDAISQIEPLKCNSTTQYPRVRRKEKSTQSVAKEVKSQGVQNVPSMKNSMCETSVRILYFPEVNTAHAGTQCNTEDSDGNTFDAHDDVCTNNADIHSRDDDQHDQRSKEDNNACDSQDVHSECEYSEWSDSDSESLEPIKEIDSKGVSEYCDYAKNITHAIKNGTMGASPRKDIEDISHRSDTSGIKNKTYVKEVTPRNYKEYSGSQKSDIKKTFSNSGNALNNYGDETYLGRYTGGAPMSMNDDDEISIRGYAGDSPRSDVNEASISYAGDSPRSDVNEASISYAGDSPRSDVNKASISYAEGTPRSDVQHITPRISVKELTTGDDTKQITSRNVNLDCCESVKGYGEDKMSDRTSVSSFQSNCNYCSDDEISNKLSKTELSSTCT